MSDKWYSVLLITSTEEERDRLILDYIAPLVDKLDQEEVTSLFHFFRYGGRYGDPRPFLRLRIFGPKTLRGIAENYQLEKAEKFGVKVEPEAYDVKSELGPESIFVTEEEVKRAWVVYDTGSRLAISIEKNRFPIENLRDRMYSRIVKFSHLFLNSLGLNTLDEYYAHQRCTYDRSVILLTQGGRFTQEETLQQYSEELKEIRDRLAEITQTLNRAMDRDVS